MNDYAALEKLLYAYIYSQRQYLIAYLVTATPKEIARLSAHGSQKR